MKYRPRAGLFLPDIAGGEVIDSRAEVSERDDKRSYAQQHREFLQVRNCAT